MTSTLSELPTVPEIGLEPPPSKLASKAFSYAKQHCTEAVYNHTIRSAYWALIIAKKLPEFSQNAQLNLDAVIIGCILHDIGWAKTPELLSTDKRFEVDGANIARDFIKNEQNQMNADGLMSEAVIQRVWDAIALHATGSIARHAAPEVALTNLGVAADFAGPSLRGPDDMALITSQEYHAIMTVFPRAGFNRDGFKEIMCWLCRTKPKTTYDNWVGSFGRNFGTNGVGAGREEYVRTWEEMQSNYRILSGLDSLEARDAEYSIQASGLSSYKSATSRSVDFKQCPVPNWPLISLGFAIKRDFRNSEATICMWKDHCHWN